MQKAIQKNALILAIFAVVCTAIVAIINLLTKDIIVEQEHKQLVSTLNSIIPPNSHNNAISKACIVLKDDLLGVSAQKAYLATMDQTPISAAITATAPDGYNGNIDLLVAITMDGTINGVRVLKHNETPGLGDKIELRKSQWVVSFNDKKIIGEIDNRWAVAKDGGMFDQFTGATITPRAVVKAVKQTVIYFNQHKDTLFKQAPNCQEG